MSIHVFIQILVLPCVHIYVVLTFLFVKLNHIVVIFSIMVCR